jgi:hypothetical protein
MKTRKLTIPSELLLDLLKAPAASAIQRERLPADARIVGTGWDRVFDENGKPFARAIFLYVESAEFDAGEEADCSWRIRGFAGPSAELEGL